MVDACCCFAFQSPLQPLVEPQNGWQRLSLSCCFSFGAIIDFGVESLPGRVPVANAASSLPGAVHNVETDTCSQGKATGLNL